MLLFGLAVLLYAVLGGIVWGDEITGKVVGVTDGTNLNGPPWLMINYAVIKL